MAEFSELPLHYRLELALYPWRRIDPVPWMPLGRPLAEARVALVTSAGLYRPAVDAPFAKVRGGDPSVRWLPDDVDLAFTVVGQTSDAFDHGPVERDRNLAFPLDHLHALVREGVIGAAATRHVSFNGSITAPGRLIKQTGPAVADVLRADQVDAALFIPV